MPETSGAGGILCQESIRNGRVCGWLLLQTAAFGTALMFAGGIMTVAETEIAAFDAKRPAVNNAVGKLFAGALVDTLYRSAGNLHEDTALLLTQAFLIDQADRFIFVDG